MTNTKRRFRIALPLAAVAGVATAAVVGVTLTGSGAGAAAARNGNCDNGEFCYYYNSNEKGSVSDFTTSVANLGDRQPSCYEFRGSGNGHARCVKNDAASVWNRSSKTVTVFYNSNYGGQSQSIKPGAKTNLVSGLKNNNASHRFGGSTGGGGGGGTLTPVVALTRAQAWVRDGIGYSTGGRHDGYRTDCSGYVSMAWGLPKPGPATPAYPQYGSYISKSSLKPGDALLNSAAGPHGHVVLFEKWANSSHTRYWAYEETGSHGAIHRTVDYPYFSGYGTFKPFHYSKMHN